MTHHHPQHLYATHLAHARERGSIFILTLSILIVLVSLAMLLSRSMTVEASSSANYASGLQAEAVAHGGIEYVRMILTGNDGDLPDASSILAQGVPVGGGYFWLLNRNFEDSSSYSFGLTDEQGKLNINTAELEVIARLPDMTMDLAAGIVDWRDTNEETESGGAESAYYATLTPPYMAKNDHFETVGELSMVKDMTPAVLYGEDANRNGVLDPNENDADASDPPDNQDGQLGYGLEAYTTVYSSPVSQDSDGQNRVNVNRGNQLRSVLSEVVPPSRISLVMSDVRRNRPFLNLIDFYYRAGLQQAEFEKIQDKLTIGGTESLGLVNLNTAPKGVLAALPGLTESDVQVILGKQQSGEKITSLTDVIKMLPREKAIAIGGAITTTSYRYSADIVATDGKGRSFKRLWVVFDAKSNPPKVLYIRDLTGLGWPLDPQILKDLRAGNPPANVAGLAGSGVAGSSKGVH